MTKCETATYTAAALLALQLGAATNEPEVATGGCKTEQKDLERCIATGKPCLDQAVDIVECLDGSGLVEVSVERIGLVVSTDSGTPEWRMTLAKPKTRDHDDPAVIYYRIGKCYVNSPEEKALLGRSS